MEVHPQNTLKSSEIITPSWLPYLQKPLKSQHFVGSPPHPPVVRWRRKPAPVAADHEELARGGRFHGHQRGQLLRMQAAHLEVNHQPRGQIRVSLGGYPLKFSPYIGLKNRPYIW